MVGGASSNLFHEEGATVRGVAAESVTLSFVAALSLTNVST